MRRYHPAEVAEVAVVSIRSFLIQKRVIQMAEEAAEAEVEMEVGEPETVWKSTSASIYGMRTRGVGRNTGAATLLYADRPLNNEEPHATHD